MHHEELHKNNIQSNKSGSGKGELHVFVTWISIKREYLACTEILCHLCRTVKNALPKLAKHAYTETWSHYTDIGLTSSKFFFHWPQRANDQAHDGCKIGYKLLFESNTTLHQPDINPRISWSRCHAWKFLLS